VPERNDSNPRRRRLGTELRKLRERAGLTTTTAAELVEDFSQSKVSRLERGVAKPKVRDVQALAELYGADASTVEGLKELARESKSTGWWHSAAQSLPERFRPLVGYEAEAAEIKNFQSYFIPGLLQTETYARELFESAIDVTPLDIEHRTVIRTGRQRRLTEPEPLQLWAVIDETALRRPIGDSPVMYEQLLGLVERSKLPNVVIQVIPLNTAHSGLGINFHLLSFADPEDRPVLYYDALSGGMATSNASELNRALRLWEHLRGNALSPKRSVALVERIAEEEWARGRGYTYGRWMADCDNCEDRNAPAGDWAESFAYCHTGDSARFHSGMGSTPTAEQCRLLNRLLLPPGHPDAPAEDQKRCRGSLLGRRCG
jgi:transcriptional regulator with XRE-family HTH domain